MIRYRSQFLKTLSNILSKKQANIRDYAVKSDNDPKPTDPNLRKTNRKPISGTMPSKAMMTQNQAIQNLRKTKPKTNIRDYAVKSDDDPKPSDPKPKEN